MMGKQLFPERGESWEMKNKIEAEAWENGLWEFGWLAS
jgi:hypothetical protein